ncbi:hypothetical protein AYO44_17115 [Planctomycetaceae bacterium SCGC AG-212-F19]|nr:hypothetical protein AYO44_17115 [Planctomycetaceae bacterium SCGC AG-212-F19]
MYCGVFFVDAVWSGGSRQSLNALTDTLGRLDPDGRLELVVVNIDESPGVFELFEFTQPLGGWGEAAWVTNGKIIATGSRGHDFDTHTRALLALWRPFLVPEHWPAAVIQLAESLYNGADCAFALHDALLEAGHAELAEHFTKETWHPKGCWVMDRILGKK